MTVGPGPTKLAEHEGPEQKYPIANQNGHPDVVGPDFITGSRVCETEKLAKATIVQT